MIMKKSNKKTQDANKILDKMVGKDSKLQALVADAKINAQVAQLIFKHRTKAKLTQHALAAKIGTTQSVIARLEDSDYDGHSLTMLQKIANALQKEISISFQQKRVA